MCNFWREYRRAINPLPQLRWHCARCGELAGPNATEWVKWHVCRKEERMSTTFKDGLKARLAAQADADGYQATGEAIHFGNDYMAGSLLGRMASAALAYCDEWEEVGVRHCPVGRMGVGHESWHRGPANDENDDMRTILIRREPPKPTRPERVEAAKAALREKMAEVKGKLPTVREFNAIESAVDAVLAAAKEDR